MSRLVLLVLLGSWVPSPFAEGSPGAPCPSQLLPSQQHAWKLNFLVSGEISWWNKFNQLFLFSFGHVHAIFTDFFQSVNSLSAHYFLRVSLKLWQLILRPSKAKTSFTCLVFPQNVTCPTPELLQIHERWMAECANCYNGLFVSFKKSATRTVYMHVSPSDQCCGTDWAQGSISEHCLQPRQPRD